MKVSRIFVLIIAGVLTFNGCGWWNNNHLTNLDQQNSKKISDEQTQETKAITQISSEEQLTTLLKDSSKLFVVKFDAPWCSACKDIEPHFVEAANKGTDYTFIRINIDILPQIAQQYVIIGIPTILFIKEGKEIANTRIEGNAINNGDELLSRIAQFSY